MKDGFGLINLTDAALFLDFDGTLVRIEDHPEKAKLEPQARATLIEAVEKSAGGVAIVSGRSIAELDRFLAPLRLPSAGLHGMERRNAGGETIRAASEVPIPQEIMDVIKGHAAEHDLLVEDKTSSVVIHFRNAPSLEQETRALVDRAAADHPTLRVIPGQTLAEIAAAAQDKGSAVSAYMEEGPFKGRTPIAVGDDTTDEDAFRMAQDLGGIGIHIGQAETCAVVRFSDIDAFQDWFAQSTASGTLDFAGIPEIPAT